MKHEWEKKDVIISTKTTLNALDDSKSEELKKSH